jgi:hypothetical protein
VQVTVTAPQAAGRFLAVCPNVAEFLAVMALRKTILCSICPCPDCDVTEAWQSEFSWDFAVLCKVIKKRGVYNFDPLEATDG